MQHHYTVGRREILPRTEAPERHNHAGFTQVVDRGGIQNRAVKLVTVLHRLRERAVTAMHVRFVA